MCLAATWRMSPSWAGPSCSPHLLLVLPLCALASAAGASDGGVPEALPYFEKAATPCAQCHASHVPAPGTPHEALAIAACTDCHQPAKKYGGECQSDQGKSWVLAAPEAKLCGKCHVTGGTGKKHKPLADGSCGACHSAHRSTKKGLLTKDTAEALCQSCHTSYSDQAVTHAPVNSGECLACHDPHAGKDEPLLVERADTLCLKCHVVEDLAKERVKHSALTEGHCVGCHDPHGGPAKGLVRNRGSQLCLPCHDANAPKVPGSASARRQLDLRKKVVHKPLAKGDCQYCHTQKHGSEYDSLLLRPAVDSCYKCHTRLEDKYKYLHGAARLGDCPVCHQPHSSDTPGLLADPKVNQVCFRCHEDDLTGRKWVHQPAQEGCTACHDPHGSNSPMVLKKPMEGSALCLECHPKVGREVSVPHKALSRYTCTSCHDPHGADQDSGLRSTPFKLCTTCHEEIQDGTHIEGFAGHKIFGGEDPKRGGRPFSCVSCHAPHGSNTPKLLRHGKDPQESCKYCH